MDARGKRRGNYVDVHGDESNVPIAGTKAAVRNVRAAASLDGGGILRADGDNVGGDIGNAVSVSKADVLRRWANLGLEGRRYEAMQQISTLDARAVSWATAICEVGAN